MRKNNFQDISNSCGLRRSRERCRSAGVVEEAYGITDKCCIEVYGNSRITGWHCASSVDHFLLHDGVSFRVLCANMRSPPNLDYMCTK